MYWNNDRNYLLRVAEEEGLDLGEMVWAWDKHVAVMEKELTRKIK